ncbi:MAG: hypothetical protein Q4B30_02520 [Coriobacteriaceae bacterium]|nr:hypothetical protein [Coriobacteriaceae bacterium]
MTEEAQQPGFVSSELDGMSCDMMDEFLAALAEGDDPGVVACVEDSDGRRMALAFSDDGDEACMDAAEAWIERLGREGDAAEGIGKAVRYAILYLGCIQEDDGSYEDAMITIFGESVSEVAYSAYTLVRGIGQGEGFMWSDPEPAGEEPMLL